jgi:hypothetical protein
LIVWAQRPHFAAQPSEAYTWLIRGRGAALAIADLTWASLRTWQEQTITARFLTEQAEKNHDKQQADYGSAPSHGQTEAGRGRHVCKPFSFP